jgi:hypothetical protein
MKTHIIAFSTLLFLAAAGSVALAQDDPAVLARLAARRAAENGGGDGAAATSPDTAAAAAADAQGNGADTNAVIAADTGATNAAADPEEAARLARLAAAAKETAAATKLPGSLASLQIITQRNIFDPNRLPWVGTPRPVVAPVRVETFTFRGTSEETGKGVIHAMFEGDGIPSFPATRDVGNMVNGFKIKAITRTNITLVDTNSTTNAEIVFTAPGMGGQQGLTRNDGGPWKPAYYTPTYETVAPRQQRPESAMAAPQYMTAQPTMAQTPFTFTDPSMDPYAGTARTRTTRNGGGRGGRGGGGGNFGGGNTQFAPASPPPDPNAPIDPAVLERLRARRASGD